MQSYNDTCPFCDSLNVRVGDLIKDLEDSIEFTVFCRDCGEDWNELEEK